jgi:glycosyltransferase involved in cell wall biosynthesis
VYRRADALVGVTESICQALARRGIPAGRISHIPNGTDTELFSPCEERAPARTGLGLNNEFAVIYAGTIGLAQGLDLVLDTAKLLRDTPDVRFVLVGDGVEKPKLLERVRREGIANVTFIDRRPRSEMPALLNAADVVLVALRKQPLFEGALPSKTSEAMACGRPVVVTIAGEAAQMLEHAGAGLAVEPGSPQALAEAVLKLKQEPELAARMGRSGREFAVRELDRTALARRLEALLLDLVNARTGSRSAV